MYVERQVNKIFKSDPLEAVKNVQREVVGQYCAISGNEPSSVTLYKTGDDSQNHVNILQFKTLLKGYLNQRHVPKWDQIMTYNLYILNILTDLKGPKIYNLHYG